MNFLINAYCIVLVGPGFLPMSNGGMDTTTWEDNQSGKYMHLLYAKIHTHLLDRKFSRIIHACICACSRAMAIMTGFEKTWLPCTIIDI